ncbi:MAG: DUF420 domain-containing protein [Candidatus Bathyarchaeota archaeon]|nr:DUF420 domain-containing protein [Candidatus Bathyarchaeota archaeon]
MIEAYQIHAALQALSLVSLLAGSYMARKHKIGPHHAFQYTALALSTLAVSIMVYQSRGLPTFHGKLGFSVYLFIAATAMTGRLFLKRTPLLGRKVKRGQHRTIGFLTMASLLFMILHGLFTFVL